jgi:hypothetical protein
MAQCPTKISGRSTSTRPQLPNASSTKHSPPNTSPKTPHKHLQKTLNFCHYISLQLYKQYNYENPSSRCLSYLFWASTSSIIQPSSVILTNSKSLSSAWSLCKRVCCTVVWNSCKPLTLRMADLEWKLTYVGSATSYDAPLHLPFEYN